MQNHRNALVFDGEVRVTLEQTDRNDPNQLQCGFVESHGLGGLIAHRKSSLVQTAEASESLASHVKLQIKRITCIENKGIIVVTCN